MLRGVVGLKRVLLVLLLAVTLPGLSGCVVGQNQAADQYQWYVGQGVNVTECGPAVAAMAVRWAGGQSNVMSARAVTRQTGLWNLQDIRLHLVQHGRNYRWVAGDVLTVLNGKPRSAVVVRLQTGIIGHFVLAYGAQDGWIRVADPLSGVRWIRHSVLESLRSDDPMIEVWK